MFINSSPVIIGTGFGWGVTTFWTACTAGVETFCTGVRTTWTGLVTTFFTTCLWTRAPEKYNHQIKLCINLTNTRILLNRIIHLPFLNLSIMFLGKSRWDFKVGQSTVYMYQRMCRLAWLITRIQQDKELIKHFLLIEKIDYLGVQGPASQHMDRGSKPYSHLDNVFSDYTSWEYFWFSQLFLEYK